MTGMSEGEGGAGMSDGGGARPARAGFDLGDYLPHLIVRAAIRLGSGADAMFTARFGINRKEWRVLAALQAEDGQGMTSLAERTSIEVSTLSRLVDGMEIDGMVYKTRKRPNARAVTVYLTDAGGAKFAETAEATDEMNRILTRGMRPAQIRAITEGLRRIYGNLEEAEAYFGEVIGDEVPPASDAVLLHGANGSSRGTARAQAVRRGAAI